MTTFNIAIIFDGIFSFVSMFVLCFCVFRIAGLPPLSCLLLAIVFSIVFSSLIVIKKRKNNKNKLVLGVVSREKSELINTLSLMKKSELIDLFKGLLENERECIIKNDCLEFENHIILLMFFFEPVSANQIISNLRLIEETKKNIIIIGVGFSPQAIAFAAQNKISLLGIDRVYDLIKQKKPNLLTEQSIKTKFKIPLNLLFQRKSGIKFIFYGIMLDIFSFLTFFPIYYVISGTIFLIYGIIATFFGQTEIKSSFSFDMLNDK